jgi:tetratricopeptide (TPR) repeat protein
MFGTTWLTLRQAREALRTGRLEEAYRLLSLPGVRGHKRAFELLRQVIAAYIERGEKHLRNDDVNRAWNDLQAAEALAPNDPVVEKFRHSLLRLGLAEVKAALEVGRPGRAAEAIARLRDRGVRTAEVHPYDEAARSWISARESSDNGEFAPALQTVDRLYKLLPPPHTGLDEFRNQIENRHQQYQKLILELHEARRERRWREVVALADHVLAVAAQSAEARKARADAWKTIEPDSTLPGTPAPEVEGASTPLDSMRGPPKRLLLWIDGVGGYLLCLSNRVTFGQATGEAPVDVPLFADVSRMHATLNRDQEGYMIEAARPVLVNGQAQTRALLQPGDRVTLGQSCQFLFQQPVRVGGSARLELSSRHRLP